MHFVLYISCSWEHPAFSRLRPQRLGKWGMPKSCQPVDVFVAWLVLNHVCRRTAEQVQMALRKQILHVLNQSAWQHFLRYPSVSMHLLLLCFLCSWGLARESAEQRSGPWCAGSWRKAQLSMGHLQSASGNPREIQQLTEVSDKKTVVGSYSM